MRLVDGLDLRRLGAAAIARDRAAVGVHAAGDLGAQRRQRSRDRVQPVGVLAHPQPRHAAKQCQRVGVPRVLEQLMRRPLLDQPARVQHAHPLADAGDDPQVVADEQDRRVELGAQLLDQVQHLGLDGGVEAGGGLVQHQQVGVGGQRHGEHDALLLAAGQLVRVPPCHPVGRRDLHRREHLDGGRQRVRLAEVLVEAVDLGDLLADLDGRVQRGAGVLVDHRHALAPPLAQRGIAGGQHVLIAEHDAAAVDHRVVGQVAHQRHGRGRLAAAGLAHQPVGLAVADLERHVVQHPQQLPPAPVADGQALDADSCLFGHGAHSSSTRRMPSAIRLTPTTSVDSARAGKIAIHQAICT